MENLAIVFPEKDVSVLVDGRVIEKEHFNSADVINDVLDEV